MCLVTRSPWSEEEHTMSDQLLQPGRSQGSTMQPPGSLQLTVFLTPDQRQPSHSQKPQPETRANLDPGSQRHLTLGHMRNCLAPSPSQAPAFGPLSIRPFPVVIAAPSPIVRSQTAMVNSSTSPKKNPKLAKRAKNPADPDSPEPSAFCSNCSQTFEPGHETESAIKCTGTCGRFFHPACSQPATAAATKSNKRKSKKRVENSQEHKLVLTDDKCDECSTGQYRCFICNTHDDKVSKCSHKDCTKWYHLSCFKPSDAYHVGDSNDNKKGLKEGQFICPLHFCLTCYIEHTDDSIATSKDSLLRCIKCPTSYHYSDDCLPAGCWFVIPGSYILCPDHLDRKKFPSFNFTHCFICMLPGDLICCESCPASIHTKCLQYEVNISQPEQDSAPSSSDENDGQGPVTEVASTAEQDVLNDENQVNKSNNEPRDVNGEQDCLVANPPSLNEPFLSSGVSNNPASSSNDNIDIQSTSDSNSVTLAGIHPASNASSLAAFQSQTSSTSTAPASTKFFCSNCTRRKPMLYGELVWAKIGHYRWWPAIITPINSIPQNIWKMHSEPGQFVVEFLGSHDYYWLWKGRVFSYDGNDAEIEPAKSSSTTKKSSIVRAYERAVIEAREKYQEYLAKRQQIINKRASKVPPKYNKIKVNKYVGKLAQKVTKNSKVSENDPNSDNTNEEIDLPITFRTSRTSRAPSVDFTSEKCYCGSKSKEQEKPCLTNECVNFAMMIECSNSNCSAGEACCNRRFKDRTYAKVKSFYTGTRGWGLKALEDIAKDTFVIEYVGELITEEEAAARIKKSVERNEVNYYHLILDKNIIIDAGPSGNLARFMNHSCAPNCRSEKWWVGNSYRMGLFAIYDIKEGQELTFNYNLSIHGSKQTPCRCGANTCSGFIGSKPTKGTAKSDQHGKSNAKRSKSKTPKRAKKTKNLPQIAQSEGSATA